MRRICIKCRSRSPRVLEIKKPVLSTIGCPTGDCEEENRVALRAENGFLDIQTFS